MKPERVTDNRPKRQFAKVLEPITYKKIGTLRERIEYRQLENLMRLFRDINKI